MKEFIHYRASVLGKHFCGHQDPQCFTSCVKMVDCPDCLAKIYYGDPGGLRPDSLKKKLKSPPQ